MSARRGIALDTLGKLLLLMGGVMLLMGVVLLLVGRVPFCGKLQGDTMFQRGSFSLCFPVATFLGMSIVLTVVLDIIYRPLR